MIKNENKKVKYYNIMGVLLLCLYIYTAYKFSVSIVHIGLLIVGVGILFNSRYDVIPYLGLQRPRVGKKENTILPEGEIWFDDYYSIKYINENTIAIGEPRYWQKNYNYLIIGEEKAILFDSGPGVRDITKVVNSLTNLPVINMISHYHFDHMGNIDKFKEVYLCDNQIEKQKVVDNTIIANKKSHLGNIEGIKPNSFKISKIVKNAEIIDIGNRKIKVLKAPGHDYESIVLYDELNNLLFAGDYLIKGPILTHKMSMPSASLLDYKYATQNILDNINEGAVIHLAHPSNYDNQTMSYSDLIDLNEFFKSVEKNNTIPKKVQINNDLYVVY